MKGNKSDAASLTSMGPISSPIATGGAGTFFEQHVAAYWLAQLLTLSIPPVFIKTSIVEVHFQTERLGWNTDDFLIGCEDANGIIKKIAGQVKRSFTVSSTNEECKKAVGDFWKDFNNSDRFAPSHDRLALVTLRGTNTLLKGFASLLDCARASRDAAEFEIRLTTKGLLSAKAVNYCDEIRKIIADLEEKDTANADIWPFLRVLHVLSLDLTTSTRQTEAQIKNLLAITATDGDAVSTADNSWNELLTIASAGMSESRSFHRADLPKELRQHHAPVGANERSVLGALKDHTSLILDGIRSTIGQGVHLKRSAVVQKALGELETSQVLLVTGPAGSGKSVIGKNMIARLSQDYFTFGFRGEEFAQPHFDTILQNCNVPANGVMLGAILAAQDRKVVLVESVERLLEKATRDAFTDLMTLARSDHSLRIVLTCRDYSVDQVRASFLQPAGLRHSVVEVPPLDDLELAEVETAMPALSYPLKNKALRNILRNPYFLDEANKISWSEERPVQESEREFRSLFWREVVRADPRVSAGMARQREEAFQTIAVRRARALSAYVACDDLDPRVVAALRHDSLISSHEDKLFLLATSHDVLEDWAILQWLEEQHLIGEGSFKELSRTIGGHPAIRRSYRKWAGELVDRDPEAADRLFRAAINEKGIASQFRDDTMVSLLKAPSSSDFLTKHEAQLLANDKFILIRVIQLLRVACMTTPTWLAGTEGLAPVISIPDGPSWATVLGIVHRNIDSFTPQDRQLLLGLIEDAVRNVSWWEPELDGAEFVAGIGHRLLTVYDDYRSNDSRKRVLQVIAKIPKVDAARFEAVLRGTVRDGERRDRIADDFREIIFSGMSGMPAARDLPDLIVSVAIDDLLASEEDLRSRYFGGRRTIETCFGIKEKPRHDHYPPSAIRGPWLPLLNYHPRKAITLFINVFNHSADWYAHPRVPEPLEPAWEIELTFADGTARKQWGNPRLWNLYRGTSVGPYVLQSMLMAMEKWLLDFASQHPQEFDGVLLDILRRSESSALAAVVASAATAHLNEAPEALLVILSAPDYFAFDIGRKVNESDASALSGVLPTIHAEDRLYEAERKEANQLPHRSRDLEFAIANLQLGPIAPRVHAILDRHRAALPPQEEQDESHRKWRLAMYRMDLRQYTVSEAPDYAPPNTATKPDEAERPFVQFDPKDLDSDLQAMVDENTISMGEMNARLSLVLWACKTFLREQGGSHDPSMWKKHLSEAMSAKVDDGGEVDIGRGGPGIVAAVCVRDHWGEMSFPQQNWCVERICSEVMTHANRWNRIERVQQNDMAADRACAWVLPLLLTKPISETQRSETMKAFAAALTHPFDQVRWYAVSGIAENLWLADRGPAMRCLNAIAMEAQLIEAESRAQDKKPYDERRNIDEIMEEAAAAVRQAFEEPGGIAEDAYDTLDVSDWIGAEANRRILTILANTTEDPVAEAGYVRAAHTLVGWWDAGDDRVREGGRRQRNFQSEAALSSIITRFLLKTSANSARQILEPIIDAIDRHPHEISSIVQDLTTEEDRRSNTSQYWHLWELFAESVRQAKWVNRLDDEYPIGREMLSAIFLTSWWKDNVRHWRSLTGYANHVHGLFESLPPFPIVLEDYLLFLYHIGEKSLPEAFIRVANSLKQGEAQVMLQASNTVFTLEVLLTRYVYGRPLELKRDPEIRESVLFLLDTLVENGSAAAFRMRDDFVTPLCNE